MSAPAIARPEAPVCNCSDVWKAWLDAGAHRGDYPTVEGGVGPHYRDCAVSRAATATHTTVSR